ncbi:acyl-CoA-binding protein [Zhouia sp. PK063]|uniref:acyl-CoA-binding protein n=1 Tax=Zhouia sp. PK063 TaxID=3373602 RepID=UPI0037BA3864
MTDEELDIAFEKAVEQINSCDDPFPADTLLRLYAYYKIATRNFSSPGSRTPLINAFKANALFQTREMDSREAKEKYVQYATDYFKNKKGYS